MTAALQSHKRRLDDDLASLATALRQQQRAFKSVHRIPKALTDTLLRIICLSDGVFDAARQYYDMKRRPQSSPPWTVLERRLQDTWQGLSEARKHDIVTDTGSNAARTALSCARKFLQQHRLHCWVREVNLVARLAPSTSSVLTQATDAHHPVRTVLTKCASPKTKQQWLRRWRLKWRVSFGRIRPRAHLPLHEEMFKA